MKKTILIITIFLFFTISVNSQEQDNSKRYYPDYFLKLIPENTKGMIFMDFAKILETEIFSESIEKALTEGNLKYLEDMDINLETDIYSFSLFFSTSMNTPGVMLINLSYNKERILSKMDDSIIIEKFEGVTIYLKNDNGLKNNPDGTNINNFAFLNESVIIMGDYEPLKAVILQSQKKPKNKHSDNDLNLLIEDIEQDTMLWGGILNFNELLKQQDDILQDPNPFLDIIKSTLEPITAVTFFMDYDKIFLSGNIDLISNDNTMSQKMIFILNGIKAAVSLSKDTDPDVLELLTNILFSLNTSGINISFKISEDLLEKLSNKIPEGNNEDTTNSLETDYL